MTLYDFCNSWNSLAREHQFIKICIPDDKGSIVPVKLWEGKMIDVPFRYANESINSISIFPSGKLICFLPYYTRREEYKDGCTNLD